MTARPWIQRQEWRELLFAHWPLPTAKLRPLIPQPFDIDRYDGQAWVGVVPFRMTGVRMRWLPSLPWISTFPEVNLRTYVRYRGQSGIYFLSLDAPSRLAVAIARRWYHLPYHRADITLRNETDRIIYDSERRQHDAPPAALGVDYRPHGDSFVAEPGSIEHFLVERYALFCESHDGRVLTCKVQHPAWNLMPAETEFRRNTLAEAAGIQLPDTKPLCWYSGLQTALLSTPEVEREHRLLAACEG